MIVTGHPALTAISAVGFVALALYMVSLRHVGGRQAVTNAVLFALAAVLLAAFAAHDLVVLAARQ